MSSVYLYLQKKTRWYQKDSLQTNSSNIALSILCLNIIPTIQVSMTGMCWATSMGISRALIQAKATNLLDDKSAQWTVREVGRNNPQPNTEALSLNELTMKAINPAQRVCLHLFSEQNSTDRQGDTSHLRQVGKLLVFCCTQAKRAPEIWNLLLSGLCLWWRGKVSNLAAASSPEAVIEGMF